MLIKFRAIAIVVASTMALEIGGIFLGVVIVPLVLPWGYLRTTYVTTPCDRWR